MFKSTNTVVYFDWKTVNYVSVCGKRRTQLMLPVEKSVTFTGACANEIIPSIDRSFVYKAKEGGHVRIICFYLFFSGRQDLRTTQDFRKQTDVMGRLRKGWLVFCGRVCCYI